jgi:serine/threonine protein kinase
MSKSSDKNLLRQPSDAWHSSRALTTIKLLRIFQQRIERLSEFRWIIAAFAYPCAGPLAFEDIDEELYDLLSRVLIKDPAERIKLREVKRHP